MNELGIDLMLGDDELIASALIIMRVIDDEGEEKISTRWTPGMSFVERRGMLEVARDGQIESLGASSPE